MCCKASNCQECSDDGRTCVTCKSEYFSRNYSNYDCVQTCDAKWYLNETANKKLCRDCGEIKLKRFFIFLLKFNFIKKNY